MIQTTVHHVDRFEFTVTQLPGMRALRLIPRLGKLTGPLLTKEAEVLQSLQKAQKSQSVSTRDLVKVLGEIDVSGLGDAFADFCSKLTETEFDYLTSELLTGVAYRVNDNPQSMASAPVRLTPQLLSGPDFVGEAPALMQLLWICLRINYSNFFKGALTATSGHVSLPASAA